MDRMLAIPVGSYQTVPYPGKSPILSTTLTPLLQCMRIASLLRTLLMFNNILGLAIRCTVYWLPRRSHVRGTTRPVVLCMTTGACPSKYRAPQTSTWN